MKTKHWIAVAGMLVLSQFGIGAQAGTLTVTTTNASGAGSLRQAILDANALADADVIEFAIPGGGVQVLTPGSALPDVTQPLTLDGFTQPGASPNTLPEGNNAVILVRLDGAGAFGANGLRLRAPGCRVRGLSITRYAGEGIVIIGVTNCVVAGNLIGLEPNGTARANNGSGVQIFDAPSNRIGGAAPEDRNVLSGNFTAGLHLIGVGASNNVIEGNFIGTSPDGSAARANFVNGVWVQDAPGNRIGGAAPGARNVISGNSPDGIRVSGGGSVGNVVLGNFIGPNANGGAGLGSQNGVNLEAGVASRVGGGAAGEGNIIAGNSGYGLRIDFSSSANAVLGNRIGVSATGGALQNGGQGILIRGSGNRLGGASAGEGNEIANNAPGIEVELGTGNAIRGNSIHDNRPRFIGFGGLGIDLSPFGVTVNDTGDGDGGVNLLQNFPILTAATTSGESTRVQGVLNSRPDATFALDFYSNPDCDPSGHGEGLKYLGSTSVTTDDGGNASFDVTLPVAAEGRQVTATATDAVGNTSEFGPCFAASVVQPPRTFLVTNTDDSGPGSLRQALLDAQAAPASANNIVAFNIGSGAGLQGAGAGGETFTIHLTTPLPTIFEGVTLDGFTQLGSSANTLLDGNNAVWGVSLNGTLLGAGANGLTLGAPGCEVRGLELKNFRGSGIHVTSESDGSLIEGCHLLDNQTDGLCVDGAVNVTIGGADPASRNVIHGNGAGILLSGATATGILVAGNFIGPDPAGADGSGNFGPGVRITGASVNLIGGTDPGAGNRIAFNFGSGVTVVSGSGNQIVGNSIVDNAGLGIELFPGANGNLAAPAVTAATILAGGGVQCTVAFTALPGTAYLLHTYSSLALASSASGQFYQGEATATTDGSGNSIAAITTDGDFRGRHLTVTVTGPDEGTSMISGAITPVSLRPPGTFTVTTTADNGQSSLRQALTDAGNFLAAGNNLIAFNIPGDGVKRIQPESEWPVPPDPVTLDAFTQPGSQPNTSPDGYNGVNLIHLDGTLLDGGTAFNLTTAGNIVRGFAISGFDTALNLGGAGGNKVQGNLIGGNTGDGVEITSPNNLIGGTDPGDRNVFADNRGSGVVVFNTRAGRNEFHANVFGFHPNSTLSANTFFNNAGNDQDGIRIGFGASDNSVGGANAGERNFFGLNGRTAVNIESGQRNSVVNNEYISQSPFPSADFVTVAPGANGGILPLELAHAYSDDLNLNVGFRYGEAEPNTIYEGEIYAGERLADGPWDARSFKCVGRFNFTTDGSGLASEEETFAEYFENHTRIWGMARDPAGNNSAASDMVKVVPAGSADVKTRLFAPVEAPIGSAFDVTLVVSNCGPATANNVVAILNFPAETEVLSTSPPGVQSLLGILYDVGNLEPGQERTFTVTVQRFVGRRVQFSAKASHDGVDSNWMNDKDTVTTELVVENQPNADLQAGTVMPEYALTAGELAKFTFLITNKGPASASLVRAVIKLPPGAIIESADPLPLANCQVEGNVVTCTRDELAPDHILAITVCARLANSDFVSDPSIERMSFTAWSATADYGPYNNFVSPSVELLTRLAISRDATGALITWPGPSPGVELLWTPSLTPPVAWTAVPPESIDTANGMNTHTVSPRADGSPPARFYGLGEKPPAGPEAEFNQVSMELDGVELAFTDWIQLRLRLPRAETVRYVNASFNGNYVIQDVPVLSGLSGTEADVVNLSFSSGTYGEPVFTANTGLSVTTQPLGGPPPSTTQTHIGTTRHVMGSGLQGMGLAYTPAVVLAGGAVSQVAQAKPGFPNREQRKAECAPAAIVNSLQYLDIVFGLQLPEADIGLQTIKDAMRWTSTAGAPMGDDPYFPDFVRGKMQHMTSRNLGIVTDLSTSGLDVVTALSRMHDVEILMVGHMACVVGIAELLVDGRYVLTLSHDINQSDGLGGGDGGTVQEVGILDPSTGIIEGISFGREFITFVIERPE